MPKTLPLLHHIIIYLYSLKIFTQPALLLFLGMSIGLTLALYHILKTVTAKQKMDISLEKLSFLWKSQDEISLNLKQEIINEIKAELGFAVAKESKTRLKIASKEVIEEAVRAGLKDIKKDEDTNKVIENKNLIALYNKIEPYLKSEEQNNVVVRLIMFLDKKGNCPSVASSSKDISNNAYKSNLTMIKNVSQFDIFKQITLTDHTIHVCNEAFNTLMEKIKERSEYQAFIAPVMIACLAHDIGKVPDMSDTYATGDHPLISARMLIDLGVPQKSDIIEAVTGHHKIITQSDNTIYIMLKAADQAARAKELSDYINSHSKESQEFLKDAGIIGDKPNLPETDNTNKIEPIQASPEVFSPPAAAKSDDLSFLANDNKTNSIAQEPAVQSAPVIPASTPEQVQNISLGLASENASGTGDYSWMILENYLSYLKKLINTWQISDNQLKVQSVALTSGVIFFNTFALGKSLTDYMKSLGLEPFNYKTNKTETENALNYITKALFTSNLLDARVNSGYYSNTVNIIQKNGSIIKAFGILIKIEAFGFMSASEVIKDMPDQLKSVKDIIVVKEKIKEHQEESSDPFSL